jgi:type III secretion protein C
VLFDPNRNDAVRNVVGIAPGIAEIGTVVDAASFAFRLNMLESKEIAKVVSSPLILAAENIESVISKSDSVYLPVTGKEVSDLFEVSGSTTLRVTPRIVLEDGRKKVEIYLDIEEGDIHNDSESRSLKSTTSISTVAVVGQNESLLIGGYSKQRESSGSSGTSFLGKIPIIGNLFAYKNREKVSSERYFLITPRILPLEQEKEERLDMYFSRSITGI